MNEDEKQPVQEAQEGDGAGNTTALKGDEAGNTLIFSGDAKESANGQ
jgi:hypothetical protein